MEAAMDRGNFELSTERHKMLIGIDSIARFGILALLAAPLQANAEATLDELCKVIGSGSEAIMTGRQNGVPLSDMMAPITKMDQADPLTIFMRDATMTAYEEPHWSTEKSQAKAIQDFRSEMELKCYQAFAGAK